jgi:hypothetical protein
MDTWRGDWPRARRQLPVVTSPSPVKANASRLDDHQGPSESKDDDFFQNAVKNYMAAEGLILFESAHPIVGLLRQ